MAGRKSTLDLPERQIHLIAKALADPRRYDILRRLGGRDCATRCSDMLECVNISPATFSHHMKELENAGLVRSEREGKFVLYVPETAVLRAYLERLKSDLA